jgi:hypothetical protein
MNRSRKLPADQQVNHFMPDRCGQIPRVERRAAYTSGVCRINHPPSSRPRTRRETGERVRSGTTNRNVSGSSAIATGTIREYWKESR